jgi:type II secretory pathway pseudopilin PulG
MKKKSGFTIVELLIGMAVTMVALAAAFLMFRDSTKANTNITQTSGMSDNMRAGLNLIVQDLIQTGTGIPTGGISIPNSAATKGCNAVARRVNRPPLVLKRTFDGPNSANEGCNVILPAIEPGNGLGPTVTSPDGTSGPATDIITIMYADNTLAMDQKPIISTTTTPPCNGTIAPDGSKITFDPACVTIGAAGIPVNTGDLLMIFNGNNPNGVLQYVSDVSGQVLTFSAGDPFNLNGRTASEDFGTILTLQNLTAGKPDGTYPPTSCSRVWMITYFLDATTDPKHPMLMRAVNFNTPQPVGETIENLQFAYNFADGTTNQLTVPTVPAPTGDNENQIRSVNVSLSARSTTTAATTGKYIRTNLATQVALRSMAYFNAFR